MRKTLFLILLYLVFISIAIKADFLYDKSIRGVVDRSSKVSMVASELTADSNGAYQGRYVVFTSANQNIHGEVRLITNFYSDYDSLDFDPPLLIAPVVGDSFFILPVYGVLFADIGEMADTNKKTILQSPYTPIKTYTDGSVYSLADLFLAARPGWRKWHFPLNINPKDSTWIIDPAFVGSADSVAARIYYPKNFNVTKGEKFDIY